MFGSNGRIAYDHNGIIQMGGSRFGFIDSHGISTIVRSNNYTTITTPTTHSVDTESTYVKVTDVSGFEGTFKVYSRTGTTITYEDPGSNASATTGTVHHLKYSPAYEQSLTQTGDFGFSVAVGCGRIVVGAPSDGKVYVYKLDGTLAATLTGSAADSFGYSVGVGSDRIVVGAPTYSSNTGRAYVYYLSGLSITNDTGSNAGDRLGHSVSVGSDCAAAGAPGGGYAKLYHFASDETKTVQGETYTSNFGAGVFVRRNRFYVTGGGYVHIFSEHGIKVRTTTAVSGSSMSLASTVATDGHVVAIGTPTYSTNAGRLHMCRLGTRTMISPIVTETKTGSSPEEMGTSVAVGSNYVVVGCPGSNKVKMYYGGTNAPEEFEVEAHLTASSFGDSVAINGSIMAVGDSGQNKVHIYKVPPSYGVHEAAGYYEGDL
jgi:hypothetical protein